ncbi:hypothetical protein ACWY2R_07500 [Enterococcus avium]
MSVQIIYYFFLTLINELIIISLGLPFILFSTTPISLALSLLLFLISGFWLFFKKGQRESCSSLSNRIIDFLILASIGLAVAFYHGNQFGDSLTLAIHYLLVYCLPIFQLICCLAYNLGIRSTITKDDKSR